MSKGYTEWIATGKVRFITNCFGRILYEYSTWPDGEWKKWTCHTNTMSKMVKNMCKKGRTFNKAELMLELL